MPQPLGLTAAVSRTVREHASKVLDLLLAEVRVSFSGDPDAVERDVVDEVRRWAARRDDEMFPGPAVVPPQEPEILDGEPSNGHRRLCPTCGSALAELDP